MVILHRFSPPECLKKEELSPANIPRSMVITWGNDHDRGEDLPGVEGYITIFGFTLQWLLDWKQDD